MVSKKQTYIFNLFASECKNALRLGVENGKVSNSQLSASSEWDSNHGAINGRLNFKAQGHRQGAWSARYNNGDQWIQVNFGLQATVTEILTQGRSNANQWVKSYSVSYSKDGLNFFTYRVNGLVKVKFNYKKFVITPTNMYYCVYDSV